MKIALKKTKNKKFIVLTIGPIILISLFLFVIKPLYKKVYETKDSLARENLVLNNLIEEGSKIDKYEELEEKMLINSRIVDEAVIRKGNEIELIRKLEEVGKEIGIKIEISDYSPPKQKATPVKEEANVAVETATNKETATSAMDASSEAKNKAGYFMVSITGDYPQFLSFLYKLENLNLIVKIESIKTSTLSIFELERMQKEGEFLDDFMPTLKSDILISYNPQ